MLAGIMPAAGSAEPRASASGQTLVVALMLAALRVWAQEPEVTREGAYWVHREAKTVPVAPHGNLQVLARGQIVVRGGSGDQIAYKLTQRVKARTEAEAKQLFGSGQIVARALGPVTRIDVHQTSSPFVKNELELSVPRHLALATLESELGGGIEAYDLDGSVNARTPAGEIHADRIGGSVSANTGGGDIFLGKVGGAVRCLTGAGSVTLVSAGGGVTDCKTGGGEMIVRDAGGPVVLSNDGGNITVDRAASSVEAHAASGLIQVGYAGGAVTADSRGGSIQVGSARGVRAESAQGTVRVRGDSGPLNVSTMVGNILAELVAGARLQDSSLAAGSGDITVLIPSNLAVSVLVTNDMGAYPRLLSDFSEVRTRGIGFGRTPVFAEGAINGGGPMLHINAGTGVIYLRRAK